MDSLLFKINLKTQYDFYYYLASFQREDDWRTFYDTLVNLPDCVEELEELKKETKRRLDKEQNTEEYVEKISGFVLDMSVLCSPVLVKIVYYMSQHYFSHYVPRYITDLSSYNYIVVEIQLIKYRIQLFLFLKFVKELLQEVNDENPVLNSILSATDVCLIESKPLSTPTSSTSLRDSNKVLWEQAFNQYIETITPLVMDLKQNHSQEYDKMNTFFDIFM